MGDELPDESVLPEDFIESPSDLTLPVVQLPGEDQLPGPPQRDQGDANQAEAADAFLNRVVDPRLQGLGLDKSPDQQPWLRIQADGPVSPLRSIAFTADGKRLCAGGEDKALWIWNQPAANQPWQLQKTAYWPIQRGERGVVNTLAVTSESNLVAVAGSGAWASNGDIFLFDATTGDLQNVLFDDKIGHRQTIVAMAFSPEAANPTLVSVDGEGKIIAWKQGQADGLWRATLVRNTDDATFPNQDTLPTLLRDWRGYNPLAMVDADTIIHAEFDRLNSLKYPIWKIVRTRISDRSSTDLAGPNIRHVAMVTTIAISPDRSQLFTADAAKLSYMWNLKNKSVSKIRANLPPAISSAFSSKGRHLVVGTTTGPHGKSQLELYDVNKPGGPLATMSTHQEVRTCDIHPDGQQVAFAQGNSIQLASLGDSLKSQTTLYSA
ncbi:MAG: hypothetical protein KDA87_20760, partial [Planctomycetales bacterium]|nr:hypothetical protein [Planctomycetales bacterium]